MRISNILVPMGFIFDTGAALLYIVLINETLNLLVPRGLLNETCDTLAIIRLIWETCTYSSPQRFNT